MKCEITCASFVTENARAVNIIEWWDVSLHENDFNTPGSGSVMMLKYRF